MEINLTQKEFDSDMLKWIDRIETTDDVIIIDNEIVVLPYHEYKKYMEADDGK